MYSLAIYVGMYCTFPKKKMVVTGTKNVLYKAKVVLLNILAFFLIFVIFSVTGQSRTKIAASVVGQFSVGEEKSSC